MSRRGLTRGELLVACAVIVLFVAITVPIYHRASLRTKAGIDVQRMRRVYLAMSLYEADNNENPPQSQLGLRSHVDDQDLVSTVDPWAEDSGKPGRGKVAYPLDPELPLIPEHSPIRLSFAYLPDFVRNKRPGVPKWDAAKLDPAVGVLACGWDGTVSPAGRPFVSVVSGLVLRIDMDGSLYRLANRGGDGEMGDGAALFVKR